MVALATGAMQGVIKNEMAAAKPYLAEIVGEGFQRLLPDPLTSAVENFMITHGYAEMAAFSAHHTIALHRRRCGDRLFRSERLLRQSRSAGEAGT